MVSFTLTVLFKGSKLLPVMAMRRLVNNKQHSSFEWVTATFLAIGCAVFLFFKTGKQNEPSTTVSGVLCLCLYVLFDSFTSNWQVNDS